MNGMTLTIKGLFGHFNYEIPLYGLDNSDGIPMSSGVTILTGPNGYGKTTILRMLEAVSKGDLEFFVNLKFEKIALRKNDVDDKLTIQKTDSGLNINGDSLSFAEYRFTKKITLTPLTLLFKNLLLLRQRMTRFFTKETNFIPLPIYLCSLLKRQFLTAERTRLKNYSLSCYSTRAKCA